MSGFALSGFASGSLPSLPFAVALVGVLIAACNDLTKFRLHNALTIPLLLSGLLYHAVVGGGSGLAGGVLGALVGGLPFIVVYAKGGMGAGDIKLLAGVGAWLGPWAVLHVLIVSGLATGCYSAGLWGWKRAHPRTCAGREGPESGGRFGETGRKDAADVIAVLDRPDKRWNAVPFGAMVALGVVVTALWID
jgi:Flp pilus assembly protein protease CpaA